MTTRADIVAEARTWLGVPWRHMGRNRQGVDCVGMPVMIAQAKGLSEYDHTGYTREPSNSSLIDHFRNNMREKPLADMRPGDVLLFADGKYPFHCGILAERYGQPSLVHAFAGRRKVVEEQYCAPWSKQTIACFEFYGLEDA